MRNKLTLTQFIWLAVTVITLGLIFTTAHSQEVKVPTGHCEMPSDLDKFMTGRGYVEQISMVSRNTTRLTVYTNERMNTWNIVRENVNGCASVVDMGGDFYLPYRGHY